MSVTVLDWRQLDANARDAALARPAVGSGAEVRAAVAAILDAVRARGDAAVAELTQRFDGVALSDFRVTTDEFDAAESALTPAQRRALQLAVDNVRRFHAAQTAGELRVETAPGVVCRRVTHPIDAVGLYVPAGSAPLPSTAVMLAVPAALAGCPTRVICTPPRADGSADPAVLVAARLAGVETVFRIGGAQAIAALAYGTETVPSVDKIFGPGNAWVTAAKTAVAADPGGAAIDLPAGPSEVLVIADATADPDIVAADLLSQAEHGPDSQVVLVTTSEALANATRQALQAQLPTLSRADVAAAALAHARLIVVPSLEAAIEVSNRYAPEHLLLQFEGASEAVATIRNAGSVFVGRWSPESVGDYCSGTNHVLPTYGLARSWSGLGVDQFRRTMTVQELTREGLQQLSAAVVELAMLEGLDAHAAAVTRRLQVDA